MNGLICKLMQATFDDCSEYYVLYVILVQSSMYIVLITETYLRSPTIRQTTAEASVKSISWSSVIPRGSKSIKFDIGKPVDKSISIVKLN